MVQANPQPAAGASNNSRRVRPIPIGEDHLQFKHDTQIQGQLDHNGKFPWLPLRKHGSSGLSQFRQKPGQSIPNPLFCSSSFLGHLYSPKLVKIKEREKG